jgi:hypothetical protein
MRRRASAQCGTEFIRNHVGAKLWGALAGAVLVAGGFSGCAGVDSATPPAASRGAAQLQVVPASINFQNVTVGQKNTQTLRLSNVGTKALQISNLSVSGRDFSVPPVSLPFTLGVNQSQIVTVAYAPSSAGGSSGLVVIQDGSGGRSSIPVSGNGQASNAALTLSPASLDFGSLAVQSTATRSVSLSNVGNTQVQVVSVSLAGQGFGFANLPSGFTLAPQQNVSFTVWFRPNATGAASGALSLSSPNLAAPVQLAMSGTGVASAPSSGGGGTPPSGAHSVSLSWGASASQVSGYFVYRGNTSGGPYTRISSGVVPGLSYGDSSVSNGATYFYVVTAVDAQGFESGYSNEAAASVPN